MICTFFGHSDTPETVKPTLKTAIIELIEKEHVTGFFVGNHGNFDRMAISILSELAKTRSIRFYVVLAYPPTEKDANYLLQTVLPDGTTETRKNCRKLICLWSADTPVICLCFSEQYRAVFVMSVPWTKV